LWDARVIRVPSLQSGSVLRPPQPRRRPARNAHSLPSFRLQGKCSRVAEGTRGAGRGESRMSAPEDRLISDGAAERFQHEAVAILTGDLDADPKVRELAIATLALTRRVTTPNVKNRTLSRKGVSGVFNRRKSAFVSTHGSTARRSEGRSLRPSRIRAFRKAPFQSLVRSAAHGLKFFGDSGSAVVNSAVFAPVRVIAHSLRLLSWSSCTTM